MTIANPVFIPRAWASDGGTAQPIPDAPPGGAGASWQQGFPAVTMTPEVSGGLPPFGEDLNGVLQDLSAASVFLQSGHLYLFSPDYISAGGTYDKGALVLSNDGSTIYQSFIDLNDTDPNSASLSGGWTALYCTGYTTIAVTGGVVNVTLQQAAARVIVLTGVLTSALQLNLPRHQLREWLIVNATTGAFTTTVKTTTGTGVAVPAGGFAQPTPVYSDATNVYAATAPLSVPIDQAATPLTIAERDSGGSLAAFAYRFTSGPIVAAYANLMIDVGDGVMRAMSRTNVQAQMPLNLFSSQVSNGQVPSSAVLQYAALLLASPALTGIPTAPTAAPGSSSTQVATTQFANPNQSAGTTGFVTLPGGFILQWGFTQGAGGGGPVAVAFPLAFPNQCWAAVVSTANRNTNGSNGYNFVNSLANAGFTAWFDQQQTGGGAGLRGGYWFAIGN